MEETELVELLEKAKCASELSYSPYSNFPVGAACLFESGQVYTGANIENASFGLSLCAERSALAASIAAGEKSKLVAVAVFSPKQKLCLPCGACRQWLVEFREARNSSDIKIVLDDDNGPKIFLLSELLPHNFKMN